MFLGLNGWVVSLSKKKKNGWVVFILIFYVSNFLFWFKNNSNLKKKELIKKKQNMVKRDKSTVGITLILVYTITIPMMTNWELTKGSVKFSWRFQVSTNNIQGFEKRKGRSVNLQKRTHGMYVIKWKKQRRIRKKSKDNQTCGLLTRLVVSPSHHLFPLL